MIRKLIKEIEFDVGVRPSKSPSKIVPFSDYEILRMACYPISLHDGDITKVLQLHISYNDQIYDVVEQRQYVLNSLEEIDLNLSKYYCELIGSAADDIDDSEKDEWIVVKMKIQAYEVIK